MILHLLALLSAITTLIWICAAALDGRLTRTDHRANPFRAAAVGPVPPPGSALAILLALTLTARATDSPFTVTGSTNTNYYGITRYIDYTNYTVATWTAAPITNADWYLDDDLAHPISLSISTNIQTITVTITNRVLTVIHSGVTNRLTYPLGPVLNAK